MSLTIDRAQFIGLVLETLFFGIYLVTLFPCFKALLWRNDVGFFPLHSIRWTMLIVGLLFAFFNILDFSLEFYRVLYAFTVSKKGAVAEFSNISDWKSVVTTIDGLVPILIGDLVLIYRCWIVYSKLTYIVILPIILWIGTAISGIGALGLEASLHANTLITTSARIAMFFLSFTIFIAAQNIVTTSLIVRRIWIIDRATSSGKERGSHSPLRRVVRIIIESGMVYTVTVLSGTVSLLTDSNGVYITGRIMIPMIGITFNQIIIRTHQTSLEYTLPPTTNSIHLTTVLPPSTVSQDMSQVQSEEV